MSLVTAVLQARNLAIGLTTPVHSNTRDMVWEVWVGWVGVENEFL